MCAAVQASQFATAALVVRNYGVVGGTAVAGSDDLAVLDTFLRECDGAGSSQAIIAAMRRASEDGAGAGPVVPASPE